MKTYLWIILATLVIVVLLCVNNCTDIERESVIIKHSVDTVKDTVRLPPIYIEKEGSIKYITKYITKKDTFIIDELDSLFADIDSTELPLQIPNTNLIITTEFTSELDTVIKDTYNIKYQYPQNNFKFTLYPKPETITKIYIKDTIEKIIIKPKEWHEKPLVRGIAAVGLVILTVLLTK